MSTAPVPEHGDFPAPPQVVVVEPHTIYLAGCPLRTEITYAISSLEPE